MSYHTRPCAAAGLESYRCRGRFGWIMIGAVSDENALSEARRSWSGAEMNHIERWNGDRYVPLVSSDVDETLSQHGPRV